MDAREIIKELQKYDGLQGRLFSPDNTPVKDGMIVRSPRYDSRTEFVLAFQTNTPLYAVDQRESVGDCIWYYQLYPQRIKDISVTERETPQEKLVLIGCSDDKYYQGGGMFYIPEDINHIRELLKLSPLNLKRSPFVKILVDF